MHYIIYKTINLINNKIYIGAHQTKDLNDGYLGSGTLLQRAINKYGEENFKREILYELNSEKDMWNKERQIVNNMFIENKDNYNISVGGLGGTHSKEVMARISQSLKGKRAWNKGTPRSNETKKKISKAHTGMHLSIETRKKISASHKGTRHTKESKLKMSIAQRGRVCSKETRQKISKSNKGKQTWLGKHHTEESKNKMSQSHTGKVLSDAHRRNISKATKGTNNPMYGSKWVYNIKTKENRVFRNIEGVQELINTGNWKFGRYHSEATRKKLSSTLKGRVFTEEHKQNIKENHADCSGKKNPFYGKTHTEETKKKIGLANKGNKVWLGRSHTKESKLKMSIKALNRKPLKWIYNEKLKKNKRVKPEDVQLWLESEWVLGRKVFKRK